MDKFTEDLCTRLTGDVQDATEHMRTLEVLVNRAERAIDILAKWYCLDTGYPKALSPDNVANLAYAQAVRELEADL